MRQVVCLQFLDLSECFKIVIPGYMLLLCIGLPFIYFAFFSNNHVPCVTVLYAEFVILHLFYFV